MDIMKTLTSKRVDEKISTLSPYIYQPLQSLTEIRFISLLPGPSLDSELQIRLTHVDRERLSLDSSDPPPYEAVSYTWGKPIFSHVLPCGDSKFLPITETVDWMLRHLRKQNRIRYLWIDAICLNQSDDDEKAQQVALMSDIYAQAKKVHIWLGKGADPSSEKVFSALCDLRLLKFFLGVPGVMTRACGDEWIQMLESFFAGSWFTRRWVIQEAALNKRLLARCGSKKTEWFKFASELGQLNHWCSKETGNKLEIDFNGFLWRLDCLRDGRFMENSLLDLLWDFSGADCRLPQDRVFAFYGIIKKESFFPKVDYAKPWQQIYASVAQGYYSSETAVERLSINIILEHLISFGSLSWKYPETPSWVPDWSTAKMERPAIHQFSTWTKPYVFKHDKSYPTGIGDTVSFLVDWIGILQRLDDEPFEVQKMAADSSPANLQREFQCMTELLIAVLLDDKIQIKLQLSLSTDDTTLRKSFRKIYSTRLSQRFPHFPIEQDDAPEIADEALKTAELALSRLFKFCKVFTTRGNWSPTRPNLIAGIGPKSMEAGDVILSTWGLSLNSDPKFLSSAVYIGFVLRRSQASATGSPSTHEHLYRFMGICFLSMPPDSGFTGILGYGDTRITLV